MAFRVGQRVQARVKHDRLFYLGKIVATHPSSEEVDVLFDDDGDTSTLPVSWVVPIAGASKSFV